MNPKLARAAIPALRWTVGLVVLYEAAHFALSAPAARQLAKMGFPSWLPFALGGAEALAAALFLVPVTRAAGGYALLIVFALAVALHLLHGSSGVGPVLVYFTAVFACMAAQNRRALEAPHDR